MAETGLLSAKAKEKLKNQLRFENYAPQRLRIRDKNQHIIHFQFNKAQLLINQIRQWIKEKGYPERYIFLKARQKGVSTYWEADIFHIASTTKQQKCAVIAHKLEASQNLYDMTLRYYKYLDAAYKPITQNTNEKKLKYLNLESEIKVMTAGLDGEDTGRSDTLSRIHCSEVAFWNNAKETLLSLLQVVPDVPKTLVVLESTANGVGGEFYVRWQEVYVNPKRIEIIPNVAWYSPDSGYVGVFISWLIDDEYTKPFESEEEKANLLSNLDQKEKELIKLGATPEHLNWRRFTIKNKAGGDVAKWTQEYPSTPEEAFLVSGRPVFDAQICYENLINAKPPYRVGELVPVYDHLNKDYRRLVALGQTDYQSLSKYIKSVDFIDNPKGFVKLHYDFLIRNHEKYRFAAGCLPDGEKVIAETGDKNIEDVHIDEKLLDRDGDFVSIINKQQRFYDGELIEIKPYLTPIGTKFTDNHPILVLKDNVIHSHSNYKNHTHQNRRYRFYNKETIYKPAGEITTKDILRYPIPKFTKLTESDIMDKFQIKKGSGTIKYNHQAILTKEFWFMVGLWLAEGYNNVIDKNRRYRISYCLSTDEPLLIKELTTNIKKLFNRSASIRVREKSCEVSFSHQDFALFLDATFGKYAHKKTISSWVKRIPNQHLLEMFRGYFTGDGCLINEKGRKRINCVSASLDLLNNFQEILLTFGIIAAVKYLRRAKTAMMRGKEIQQKDTYELNLSSRDTDLYWKLIGAEVTNTYTREKHKGYAWIEQGFLYIKIHRINKTPFKGYVNNFETATNSYCCRLIATHNSDIAEGLEQGDYTVCKVLDRKTNKVILTWYGHLATDLYAEELHKLQIFLGNDVYFAIERNNNGLAVIVKAFPLGVKLYYEEQFDKGYVENTEKIGFRTSDNRARSGSRTLMINDLNAAIRDKEYVDEEKEFWNEALTFVYDAQGKAQAQGKHKDPNSKCYDDRIFASLGMWVCHLWMPNYKVIEAENTEIKVILKRIQQKNRLSGRTAMSS